MVWELASPKIPHACNEIWTPHPWILNAPRFPPGTVLPLLDEQRHHGMRSCLYFFASWIAQVALSILFKRSRQHGQSGQQLRNSWFKYDLGQKYHAPEVRPDRGSNSWFLDHDSTTVHVTETPALTSDSWSLIFYKWLVLGTEHSSTTKLERLKLMLTLTVLVTTTDAQVGGDGGCRVGEVWASTTSPMPNHKGFKLQ